MWKAANSFHKSFLVGDTFYIRERGVGLMRMTGDSLQLLPGGELFADKGVRAMLPFARNLSHTAKPGGAQVFLAGTRDEGLFIFNGKTFHPFEPDPFVQTYLFENKLYHGAVLQDSSFALATAFGGVIVIDQEGNFQQIIDKAGGLRDQAVKFVYPDRQGGLWLALNNGLARVEFPAPFSFYSEASGVAGYINSILRYDGEIYAAGNTGIFRLLPAAANRAPVFQPVSGAAFHIWSLLATEEALLAAAGNGIYRIEKNRVVKLADTNTTVLYQSRYDRNLVFAGLKEGLAVLKKQGGQWRVSARVAGISEEVRTIAEESQGILWLGALHQGILRVTIPDFPALTASHSPENLQNPGSKAESATEIFATVQHFGPQQELPTGTGRVFFVKERVVFATNKGLKRFGPEKEIFLPDTSFGAILADTARVISHVLEDARGRLWVKTTKGDRRETGLAIPESDGHYSWNSAAFERIADWGSVYDMYADPQHAGVIWLGGPEGIARYDHSVTKDYTLDFPALVRRVVTLKGDSLIYGGAAALGMTSPPAPLQRGEQGNSPFEGGGMSTMLPYTHNALRFQFAASSFDDPTQNRYQVFLEGFDENWSNWIAETQKDYTNIPEGDYAFRVRAKNIYGHLSEEGRYQFTILPPWYRSWWMYLIYLAAALGGIFLIVRVRVSQVEQRTKELEKIVVVRTADLRKEKEKTEQQAEALRELNTLKSQFFANISHEFRTPLTLILGQIESLLPNLKQEKNIQKAKMALRNAGQLQRLINQLLDLSKFDAHQMTFRASEQNIVPLLRHLTRSFESLAEQKNITLRFESSRENIAVFFERDKIEKVMHNLLSNAFKFTPAGGRVNVDVGLRIADLKEQTTPLQNQSEIRNPKSEIGEVKITVRDSGIGIPKDRLPYVFDRFFQVDSSTTREYEGTGIGLALTRELVQIHGGSISVESSEGFGTTFTVRLPLGKAHLKPEQIVEREAMSEEQITGEKGHLQESGVNETEDTLHATSQQADNEQIVLIVEDNPDMRAYIRETLAGDYRVLEVPNGEEGFQKAQEEIPDLVITDVMMPKMDGYEMTRKLRQEQVTSHIPIIMLTAKAAESDKFEGLETGVDAFLIKPFNTKELQIRVRKLIELRQQLLAKVQQQPIITASKVMVSSVEQQFLERLQKAVEENLSDENFQVEELCREIGMSRRQLLRKLNALLDCSPAFYIRRIRLERAKQLLEQRAGNVTEIAFEVGYGNLSAFTRAFKEAFHKSPSDILKQE
ncbi:MAG: response regulator [Calditrichae bacterium]|nr:response regulator [Calditrichia bacterium]